MTHYHSILGRMTLIDMPALELVLLVVAIAIGGTTFGWAAAALDAGRVSRDRGLPMMIVGGFTALGGTMYVVLTVLHHA